MTQVVGASHTGGLVEVTQVVGASHTGGLVEVAQVAELGFQLM